MSITNAERRNVAFYSGFEVDKVVRVYTGQYSSGDLITRVGDFATAYVHRIPHDVGRPMMCEVLTSSNGGASYDSGVSQVAFSDSSYVYIFHGYATTGTPVDYKVYCSWIDDYDDTNPLVETQQYTSEPVQFDSGANYQKIRDQDVLSFTPGTFGATETQTIDHDLGYTPNVKVFFEAFSGEVWPLNIGGARNPLLYTSTQDECQADIYDDRVEITYYKFSNDTRRAWYRLYYDAD